ncbi:MULTISPECIES: arsinothricin resistance N-acetyltransferase ArsN1 family B [Xanthomonas]|uniref:arsinothricin resistance N-acetyltransferase ArsN1 family B n=1 Tax=Xanthomonas TaxID=338 RepID=UPI001ADA7F00|nr:arsinothricin resistance N-acetyltransferase ArsN1 family B [Xanthomonas sp. A6251]MBO9874384.1 N-acetyltransferase [Xanthomonas sp. D-93]WNH46754.1 GNAT family N-acetyltransferase [Xanthomonas sp. A6251]
MTAIVVPASPVHAQRIADIYNHYIANTCVTFELDPVTSADMAKRIADVQSIGLPWLVVLEGDDVAGYAYATQWRARKAYQSSVESTIYLADGRRGRGLGTVLYGALIETLQRLELHAVIGGVAQPNDASARLHEALGFKKVAHFEQVGYKLGRWVDVAYWQLLLPVALHENGV